MTISDTGLEGNQVLLRPFRREDVDDRYVGWLNDTRVTRFSNQRFHTHTRASGLAYWQSFQGSDNHFLAVCSRDTRMALGTMTAYVKQMHGTADIGIMIGDVGAWGQGVGFDAWRTLADWLLANGIRKVTGGAASTNVSMIRIMERYGMRREATLGAQEIIDGSPVDLELYAKFRSE